MFWVEYGYNQDWRIKKQQVHWAYLENEAPKASRFQHVKFSSSDCPIVPRFGFCSYFWKWKPPWGKNFLNLIIFLPSNVSKCVKTRQNASKSVKFTKIVNFGGRDPRFWVSVYLSLKRCQYKSNFQNLSISILEIQDLGYLSICQSYKHI